MSETNICNKCILPSTYANEIEDQGVCNFCASNQYNYGKKLVSGQEKKDLADKLEKALLNAKGKGKHYDVAVGFSGGKDSAYLCMKLQREYGLRVLGIAIDHSFFPAQVEDNIRKISEKLELDCLYYRIKPSLMEKYFNYKFTNYKKQSKAVFDVMCGDCSNIIEGSVMKLAAQMDIPLVLIGLSPEQTNRYFFEVPKDHVEQNWVPDLFHDEVFTDEERGLLWNPTTNAELNLKVYFPFHVWDYNVEEIAEILETQGVLTKTQSDPLNTECKVLQTMRFIDKQNLGYDPRIVPFADLVRFGKASREEMIRKFYQQGLDEEAIEFTQNRLNLNFDILIHARESTAH